MARHKHIQDLEISLTSKQKKFSEEYVIDWNKTRAAIAAGYSEKTATQMGYENLKKPYILEYIEYLKTRTEELAGVSLLKLVKGMDKIFEAPENQTLKIRAADSIHKYLYDESRRLSKPLDQQAQAAVSQYNRTPANRISTIYTRNLFAAKKKRIVINRGGTRSTKSYSIAQIAIDWLITGEEICEGTENLVFSIVRKALPSLRAGIIKDIENIIFDRDLKTVIDHHKTDKIFKFEGRSIDYFSIDDEQKVRGRKRDYLFVDEANEIGFEDFLQLSFRTAGTLFFAFNPDDPHIWLNTELEQTRTDCTIIKSSYLDNPYLADAQVKEIELLRQTDEEFWQVFGLGEYGSISGQIFKDWKEFTVLPQNKKFYRLIGIDYGSEIDPSAIIEIYIDRKAPNVYLYEKLYESTKMLNDIYYILGNEKDELIVDAHASTLFNELCNTGYNAVKSIKGQDSILMGIDIVRKYNVYYHIDSLNIAKEVRLYKRAKNTRTNQYLKNPIDKFNHAIDAIRYGITHYDHFYGFEQKFRAAAVSDD